MDTNGLHYRFAQNWEATLGAPGGRAAMCATGNLVPIAHFTAIPKARASRAYPFTTDGAVESLHGFVIGHDEARERVDGATARSCPKQSGG